MSCSVPGCNNTSENGFRLKNLPKDPVRRHAWITILNCQECEEEDPFYVCEVHFEPRMWEKIRMDGSQRLKINALPSPFVSGGNNLPRERLEAHRDTIVGDAIDSDTDSETIENIGQFVHSPYYYRMMNAEPNGSPGITKNTDRKQSKGVRGRPRKSEMETETEIEIVYIQENNNGQTETLKETVLAEEEEITETSIAEELLNGINKTEKNASAKAKKNKFFALYKKTINKNKELRIKTKEMANKLRDLQTKIIELQRTSETNVSSSNPDDEGKHLLRSIFNEDQIEYMNSDSNFTAWSDATIEKASRLKCLCGSDGYDELLKQNYPLPPLRTLQEREVSELDDRSLLPADVNNISINSDDTTI